MEIIDEGGRVEEVGDTKRPPKPSAEPQPQLSDRDFPRATLDLVRTQLLMQGRTFDNIDLKILGVLALNGAVAALDVALKDQIGDGWWIPLLGLLLSALICLTSITGGKELGVGPKEMGAYYHERAEGDARQAFDDLLRDAIDEVGNNRTILDDKDGLLTGANAIVVVTIVLSLAVFGIVKITS
jgi:hypothetical protein